MLALPATFLYAPLMLTLLSDVFAHAFELRNRWILLFAMIAASQMLTAFYAFVVRHTSPVTYPSGSNRVWPPHCSCFWYLFRQPA